MARIDTFLSGVLESSRWDPQIEQVGKSTTVNQPGLSRRTTYAGWQASFTTRPVVPTDRLPTADAWFPIVLRTRYAVLLFSLLSTYRTRSAQSSLLHASFDFFEITDYIVWWSRQGIRGSL